MLIPRPSGRLRAGWGRVPARGLHLGAPLLAGPLDLASHLEPDPVAALRGEAQAMRQRGRHHGLAQDEVREERR